MEVQRVRNRERARLAVHVIRRLLIIQRLEPVDPRARVAVRDAGRAPGTAAAGADAARALRVEQVEVGVLLTNMTIKSN